MSITVSPSSNDTKHLLDAIDRLKRNGGGVLDVAGQLKVDAPLVFPPGTTVQGDGTAVLTWTADLGPGVSAVSTDPSCPQDASPIIRNVALQGPGIKTSTVPLGKQLCDMDGFAPGSGVTLEHCRVHGFRAGVVIRGDHTALYRVRSSGNFYNLFMGDKPFSGGNTLAVGCWFDGPLFASIAIAGDNQLDGSNLIQCHLGFGPYGIYKFDGPSGPSTKGIASATRFDCCAWEAIGNGCIFDESTGQPNGQDSLFGCEIVNPCVPFWADDMRIAGRPRDYAIKVRRIQSCRLWGGNFPFLPGDKGVLFASGFGDLDWDIGRYGGDLGMLFGTDPANKCIGSVVLRDGVKWQASLCTNNAGRVVKKGEPMEMGGGWFQANAFQTQALSHVLIAMHDAQPGAPLLVATQGRVPALCSQINYTGTPLYAVPGSGIFTPSQCGNILAQSVGNGSGLVDVVVR